MESQVVCKVYSRWLLRCHYSIGMEYHEVAKVLLSYRYGIPGGCLDVARPLLGHCYVIPGGC